MGTAEQARVRLSDVADILMGQSPPGSNYNETGDGLPFFQGVRDFNYRFPTPRVYCSAPSRIAHAGDILLSIRAPIGRVNVATQECAIGRGLACIRPRNERDARFLEFALRSLETHWATIEGSGSVLGNATRRDLESLDLPWPADRHDIASILGTLDDKIELNRHMSQTPEEMARALFESWFIDFDPVRAKMTGRWRPGHSLPRLPAHLYDLFPDHLVPSELGKIPAAWQAGCLEGEFAVTMGQSPPGSTYNESGNGVPFYQGRADFGFRFPPRRVFCTAPARMARAGDTLISVRAPVGCANIELESCAIGRGAPAVRHGSGSASYTYHFMHSLSGTFSLFKAEGQISSSISKTDLRSIPCSIPPIGVVMKFKQISRSIASRIKTCDFESHNHISLRRTLLPTLVSQIRQNHFANPRQVAYHADN